MTRPAPRPSGALTTTATPTSTRATTKASRAWYATGIEFQAALLRDVDVHDEHIGLITSTLSGPTRHRGRDRVWTFTHAGLNVPGRLDPVPATVEFHEQPNYATFGLEPYDFPLVFADPGAQSKHRHQNVDALCLWFPGDPEHRRWHYTDGLVSLFNLARNHLFYESYWRATGGNAPGSSGGTWLGDEAAHDFAEALAEVS